MGDIDYVALKNMGTKEVNLNGYTLFLDDPKFTDTNYTIRHVRIKAGQTLYFYENSSCPSNLKGSCTNMNVAINLASFRGGNTYLCTGSCSSSTVLDLHSYKGGTNPSSAMYGAKFSPGPSTGITSTNHNFLSFVRQAKTGSYPNFKQSDWTVGRNSVVSGYSVVVGGSGNDYAVDLVADAQGNTYVTGYFESSTLVLGSTTLKKSAATSDIFVGKISPSGKWLWAKRAGSTSVNSSNGIAMDSKGNVYITGRIYPGAVFGSTTVTTRGFGDVFVAKLDPSGNWQWVRTGGGTSSDHMESMAIDHNDNIYITGRVSDNAKFVTGATTLSINTKSASLDIFVAKLNSAGSWQWVRNAGGTGWDSGYGIDVDKSGNVYLVGNFSSSSADFGTYKLSSKGSSEVFVAKLNSSGTWQWARSAGGTSAGYGRKVRVDAAGGVYISGHFYSSITLGSLSLSSRGSLDIMVAKLDSNGLWKWAKRMGAGGWDETWGMDVDASGNVYLQGTYSNIVGFATTSLTSMGSYDLFLTKLSSAGNWVWTLNGGGGTGADYSKGVFVGKYGYIHLTGLFSGSPTSTATIYGKAHKGYGKFDIYVSRLSSSTCSNNQCRSVWAKSGGSTGKETAHGVVMDSNGNTYILGYYEKSTNWESTSLPSNGNNNLFVAKYDKGGNFINIVHVTGMGGSASPDKNSMAIDSNNNIYIAGSFRTSGSSSVRFGSLTLKSQGSSSVYVAKLNSDLTFTRVFAGGSSLLNETYGVTTDKNNNVFITGAFQGPSSANVATFGSYTLTSKGGRDVFVVKLSSSLIVKKAFSMGGTDTDWGRRIATDSNNNVIVTGLYVAGATGSTAFTYGISSIKSGVEGNVFVAKFTNDLAVTKVVVAQGGTGPEYVYGLTVDSSDNIYIAGYWYSKSSTNIKCTFGSLTVTNKNSGSSTSGDSFVAKLDKNLKFTHVADIGSSEWDNANDIASDGKHVYVVGSFRGTMKVDALSLKNSGTYVTKLDGSNLKPMRLSVGGNSSTTGEHITADSSGNYVVLGRYSANTSLGSFNLSTKGSHDIFVAKNLP